MIMLDNTVANVALPSIQDDLGASLAGLEWTVNAYTLTFAVSANGGGTFGVAAFGALFQHLSSERLADSLSGMASSQRDRLVENLGSGAAGDRLAELDPGAAQQVGRAVEDAFMYALSSGMWLATGMALVGCGRGRGADRRPRGGRAPSA